MNFTAEQVKEDKEFLQQIVARAWCDPKNAHKEFDADLANSIVEKTLYALLTWKDLAVHMSNNSDYYRGLLDEIGDLFGRDAYTCDDGSLSEDILRAKVPELVRNMFNSLPRLTKF